MDNELMATLVIIRNETRMAARGLNGDYDSQFKGMPGMIENYRSGWAKSSINTAIEHLDVLLVERDSIIYEMEAKMDALTGGCDEVR